MTQRLYQTKVHGVDELKRRILSYTNSWTV